MNSPSSQPRGADRVEGLGGSPGVISRFGAAVRSMRTGISIAALLAAACFKPQPHANQAGPNNDRDHDGVLDSVDMCPDTPSGFLPGFVDGDHDGCAGNCIPSGGSDGGLASGTKCEDGPCDDRFNSGVDGNSNGQDDACELAAPDPADDQDHDGVGDGIDQCNGEPGPPPDGCPPGRMRDAGAPDVVVPPADAVTGTDANEAGAAEGGAATDAVEGGAGGDAGAAPDAAGEAGSDAVAPDAGAGDAAVDAPMGLRYRIRSPWNGQVAYATTVDPSVRQERA